MNRIDRLFGIATLLQTRKYVLAEQIAEQFAISVRTVYRDIKALAEQGIPLGYEPQRGYFLVPGYFLPPVAFTPEEANALVLLETLAATLGDASIQDHARTALHKVKAVLRAPEKDRLEHVADRVQMHLPEYAPAPASYLATLQLAIARQHMLDLEYRDKNQQVSQRQVEAIGLAFYNFAWHLIGWCHLRQAYRDFKVERLQRVSDTGLAFRAGPHISLTEYVTQRLARAV